MTKEVFTLVICDSEDLDYWQQMRAGILQDLGPVNILNQETALQSKPEHKIDLIVIDLADVGNIPSILFAMQSSYPDSKIVVISIAPTWKQAREAFYLGAVDYTRKPYDQSEMISLLKAALLKGSHKVYHKNTGKEAR